MNNDFYSELLIEYSQEQSYRGEIDNPSFSAELLNPLCGDKIKLEGKVDGEILTQLLFSGQGCAISQASAAILCVELKGKTVEEARQAQEQFSAMILTQTALPDDALGDAKILAGVGKLPGRHRCALLAWENLKTGLANR